MRPRYRRVPPVVPGSIWQLLASADTTGDCAALSGYWHVWNTAANLCRYHSRNRGIAARICNNWRAVAVAR